MFESTAIYDPLFLGGKLLARSYLQSVNRTLLSSYLLEFFYFLIVYSTAGLFTRYAFNILHILVGSLEYAASLALFKPAGARAINFCNRAEISNW